jgi:transposase-like protein
MEGMGKKPRRRRSFTAEFKAEIVELCQRGVRSVGQVAKDFDLTETAVREWVRQTQCDAGTGDPLSLPAVLPAIVPEVTAAHRRHSFRPGNSRRSSREVPDGFALLSQRAW